MGRDCGNLQNFGIFFYLEITSFLIIAGDNGIVQSISVLRGRNAVLYHDRI